MNSAEAKSDSFVDAIILGREYRVACDSETKAGLKEAVALLDRRMREIASQAPSSSVERVAVMAALHIAYELLNMKSPDGFDIPTVRRRIVDMGTRIDNVFTQKELKL